jgi:adenylate kinase
METKTIIFIGPQGSGKGTQVKELITYIHGQDNTKTVLEVQTGKGFRELAEGESYTSFRIKDILNNGGLVPDFLTQAIVVNQLIGGLTSDTHLIMDGFPRNLEQARFIDDLLAFYLRANISVVYLDTPEDVVRERMLARGRSDDTEASINERLRLYKEMTEPLLDYYQSRDNTEFVTVDGAKTISEVQVDIKTGLKI